MSSVATGSPLHGEEVHNRGIDMRHNCRPLHLIIDLIQCVYVDSVDYMNPLLGDVISMTRGIKITEILFILSCNRGICGIIVLHM